MSSDTQGILVLVLAVAIALTIRPREVIFENGERVERRSSRHVWRVVYRDRRGERIEEGWADELGEAPR